MRIWPASATASGVKFSVSCTYHTLFWAEQAVSRHPRIIHTIGWRRGCCMMRWLILSGDKDTVKNSARFQTDSVDNQSDVIKSPEHAASCGKKSYLWYPKMETSRSRHGLFGRTALLQVGLCRPRFPLPIPSGALRRCVFRRPARLRGCPPSEAFRTGRALRPYFGPKGASCGRNGTLSDACRVRFRRAAAASGAEIGEGKGSAAAGSGWFRSRCRTLRRDLETHCNRR